MRFQLTDYEKDDMTYNNFAMSLKDTMRFIEKYKGIEEGAGIYLREYESPEEIEEMGPMYDDPEDYYMKSKTGRQKFVVVYNDNGILWLKKVLLSGQLSEYFCLQEKYPHYEAVEDEAYADAILLDAEYDPTKEIKDIAKRRAKVASNNAKKRLKFDSIAAAYGYMLALKKGDTLWIAKNSYGDDVFEMVVDKVNIVDIDLRKDDDYWSWAWAARPNKIHYEHGLDKVVKVILKYKYFNSIREFHFYDLCECDLFMEGGRRDDSNFKIFVEQPETWDEVNEDDV